MAQVDQPLSNSHHFNTNTSRMYPALLGVDHKFTNITFFNFDAAFNNDLISYQAVRDATNDGELNISELDFKTEDGNNNIRLSTLFEILSFSTAIKKNEEELFTFKAGFSGRSFNGALVPNDLLSLLSKGNTQFEGKSIDISPAVTSLTTGEIYLGGAFDWKFLKSNLVDIRTGLNVKYFTPISAGYFERDQKASFYTAPRGEYIDVDYNIDGYYGVSTEEEIIIGKGLGLDIGMNASILNNFFVHLGITDIGSVKVEKGDTRRYSSRDSFRFEGVNLDKGTSIPLDSIFQLNETTDVNFDLPLPTTAQLTIGYRTNSYTKKDVAYHPHTLKLSYIEGFRSSNVNNYIGVSYVYDLNTVLNLGINTGLVGFQEPIVGTFLSVRGGPFRFGIGTSNILAVINNNSKTAGVQSNISFVF